MVEKYAAYTGDRAIPAGSLLAAEMMTNAAPLAVPDALIRVATACLRSNCFIRSNSLSYLKSLAMDIDV